MVSFALLVMLANAKFRSFYWKKHALHNTQNDCHQCLSHSHIFRVHRIRFRPGQGPWPRWGNLQRSRAGLMGTLLLRGMDGEGSRRGRGRPPNANSWIRPCSVTPPACSRKYYCTNSNQTLCRLCDDKDHQIRFVGSQNMRITNPIWWTDAILKSR